MKKSTIRVLGLILFLSAFSAQSQNKFKDQKEIDAFIEKTDAYEMNRFNGHENLEFPFERGNISNNTGRALKSTYADAPDWNWIMQYGGSGTDYGNDIVMDTEGNIYITGYFSGTTTIGTTTLNSVGLFDMITAKYDNAGELLWIKQTSCEQYESMRGIGIALDISGNIIVTGWFNGTVNFDGTIYTSDEETMFLASYSNSGNLIWAYEGNFGDGKNIEIDDSGNIYVLGSSAVAKYNSDGGEIWTQYYDAQFEDMAIQYVESYGWEFYVVGKCRNGNAPFNEEGIFWARGACDDGNIGYVEIGQVESYNKSNAYSIELDTYHNMYIAGYFYETITFHGQTFTGTWETSFLAKINGSAYQLDWLKHPESTEDYARHVCLDDSENPIIFGHYQFSSITFDDIVLSGDNNYLVKYDPNGNLILATNSFFTMNNYIYNNDIYQTSSELSLRKLNENGNLIWEVRPENNSGFAYLYYNAIDTDENGNICFYGNFTGFCAIGDTVIVGENGSQNLFYGKMKGNGESLWQKYLSSPSSCLGTGISYDQDGNIYLTFHYSDTVFMDGNVYVPGFNGDGLFYVKLDPVGNILWTGTIGGRSVNNFDIAVDAENSLIISGWYHDTLQIEDNIYVSIGSADIFTVKYNSSGNLQWVKTVEGSSTEWARSVDVDQGDNILVTGYFQGTVSFETTELIVPEGDLQNLFVVKYDTHGNELWAKQAEGILTRGHTIVTDAENNFYVSGFFINTANFDDIELSATYNNAYNIFVTKYDADGNALWAKPILSSPYGVPWPSYKIDVDEEGNCYVNCVSFQDTLWFHDGTELVSFNDDAFIAKYTPAGDIDWIKQILSEGNTGFLGLEVYDKKSILAFGFFSEKLILDDIILYTTSRNGFISLLGDDLPVLDIKQLSGNQLSLIIYPNPSGGLVNIKTGNPYNKVSVEITNITGQVVYSQQFDLLQTTHQIDLSEIAKGIYFVKVQSGNLFKTEKLIIE